MKKILSAAAVAAVCIAPAFGQSTDSIAAMEARMKAYSEHADSILNAAKEIEANNEYKEAQKRIWGRGRYTRLAYVWSQTQIENDAVAKSKWTVNIQKGTVFYLPIKPLAGMVKFGIDAEWMDLQFAKYDSPYKDGIWTSDNNQTMDDYYQQNPDRYDGDSDDFNIGRMALSYALGIGPSVHVAPFANSGIKGLQPLRASLYFHYKPAVTAYLESQDGDTEISTAFVNMMSFGGYISYRKIAVGIEGVWGKGKFDPLDIEVDEGMSSSKYTRKFANTRLYLQFSF